MQEMLVILDTARTVAALETAATVRQRYGDRVFVVTAADPARLHDMGAVFADGAEAAHAGAALTQTEQFGIDAWNLRPSLATKPRHGEGLAWDTEGFEPP